MFHQIGPSLVVLYTLSVVVFAASSSSQVHPPLLLPICPFEHRHLKRDVAQKPINPAEKASWFKDTKPKEIISNHRYLYYGTTDKLGRRSGRGFLINHLDSTFYIGGMCNNMRHYYGIELQPSEHSPGYKAYAYYWNQGIPVLRASIPPHLKTILKRLANCRQMYYLLANLLVHIPRANCDPFLDCRDGTEAKETVTDYAAPSIRAIKPHDQEIVNGSCITHNTVKEKSVDGFSPKYNYSSLYLLRGKATGNFGLHLFTLDPEYHPRAKLYSRDSDERWIPVKFEMEGEKQYFAMVENQDYLLEIGMNPSKESNFGTVFGKKTTGGFACLFTDTLPIKLPSLMGTSTFEDQQKDYTYSVSLAKGGISEPGEFIQKVGSSRSYRVGVLNRGITPYYSTSNHSITIFYTGGDRDHCPVERKGQLVITNAKGGDVAPILSVTEPSACSYVGRLATNAASQLFDLLEKNKVKMMPEQVK